MRRPTAVLGGSKRAYLPTVAATAATAATATAATAAAAAAAAAAAWTTFLCNVDAQVPTVKVSSIQCRNSRLGIRFVLHLDECEAARAASITIHDDIDTAHLAAIFTKG